MEISEKYNEYHEHDFGMCIEQHMRKINGKEFIFTRTADSKGSTILVSEQAFRLFDRRHLIKTEY